MVQVFSGVMHGFALRGNMSIERNRWAKEESARACRDWYVVETVSSFQLSLTFRHSPSGLCRFDRFL